MLETVRFVLEGDSLQTVFFAVNTVMVMVGVDSYEAVSQCLVLASVVRKRRPEIAVAVGLWQTGKPLMLLMQC